MNGLQNNEGIISTSPRIGIPSTHHFIFLSKEVEGD
jgi:hypothetical protein